MKGISFGGGSWVPALTGGGAHIMMMLGDADEGCHSELLDFLVHERRYAVETCDPSLYIHMASIFQNLADERSSQNGNLSCESRQLELHSNLPSPDVTMIMSHLSPISEWRIWWLGRQVSHVKSSCDIRKIRLPTLSLATFILMGLKGCCFLS